MRTFLVRRVSGNVGATSDYDVAVLLDYDVDILSATTKIAHELAGILQTDRIDVVALNQTPIEFAYSIIAQGQVLYQHDNVARG